MEPPTRVWLLMALSAGALFVSCDDATDSTCDFPGQCTSRLQYLDSFFADSEHECQYRCIQSQQCTFYTYYSDLQQCWRLKDCSEVTNGTCVDCLTSHVTCSGYNPQCNADRRCEGPALVRDDTSPHENECRSHCLELDDCLYYSFAESTCLLTSDCHKPYDDSIFGHWERTCDPEKEEDKILIVGGRNASDVVVDDVEVVDLSDSGYLCEVEPYNFTVEGLVANFGVEYRPLFCGGYNVSGLATDDCFYLSTGGVYTWNQDSSLSPSLDEERADAAAVQLDRTRLWIVGGGVFELTSTELLTRGYIDTDSSFQPGIDLQIEGLREHNAVAIEDGLVLIFNGGGDSVYLVDAADPVGDFSYELVGDNPSPRRGAFAGRAVKADGSRQVVFAGGYPYSAETWIYEVDANSSVWVQGPDFPQPAYKGASVQYGSSTFLALGGELEDGSKTGSVYAYDPDVPEWTLLPQEMVTPRSNFAAVMMTSDYVPCFPP